MHIPVSSKIVGRKVSYANFQVKTISWILELPNPLDPALELVFLDSCTSAHRPLGISSKSHHVAEESPPFLAALLHPHNLQWCNWTLVRGEAHRGSAGGRRARADGVRKQVLLGSAAAERQHTHRRSAYNFPFKIRQQTHTHLPKVF